MASIEARVVRLENAERLKTWLRLKRILSVSSVEQLESFSADVQKLLRSPAPAHGKSPLDGMSERAIRELQEAEIRSFFGRRSEDLRFFRSHLHWPMEMCPQDCAGKKEKATRIREVDNNLLLLEIALLLEIQKRRDQQAHDRIWELCGKDVASWEAGPLLWLTRYTKTEDTHWRQKGTPPKAPFPKKDYLRYLLEPMISEDVLFVPKSREMMTSWLSCGYIAWMIQWFPVQWIIQTQKQEKVIDLINYCRILCREQEPWMKERNPLVQDTQDRLRFKGGGQVIGVPSGADQFRSYHPYGVFFDEAAFLTDFERAFCTVKPVAKKILAVSSVAPGFFSDMCQLRSHDEGCDLVAGEQPAAT